MWPIVVAALCLAPLIQASDFPLVADPPLPRPPSSALCASVHLFALNFTSYDTISFPIAVPSSCLQRGKTRVVLTVECSVTPGRQFDRSLYIAFGDSVVVAGTTSEPMPQQGPTWVIETDLTEYLALLRSVDAGWVQLGTQYSSKYNGIPSANASLQIYSVATTTMPPDVVISMGTATSDSALHFSFPSGFIPPSTARAYLSVQAQGQYDDEFWWSCVPNNYSKALGGACGGGAFRTLSVFVDDVFVQIFPVEPYLFTGGVDPYLWRPTPAPQTLKLLPQRIHLHPGLFRLDPPSLNHTITLQVGPTPNSFWFLSASMFLYVDPQVVGRGMVSHNVVVNSSSIVLALNTTSLNGTLAIKAHQVVESVGFLKYLDGSNRTAEFSSLLSFQNVQTYSSSSPNAPGPSTLLEVVEQSCEYIFTMDSETWTRLTFPLYSNMLTVELSQNRSIQHSVFHLGYGCERVQGNFSSLINNTVDSSDMLFINQTASGGYEFTNANQASSQRYLYEDSEENCYDSTVAAVNNTKVSRTFRCNNLASWVNPYTGKL